MTTSDSAFVRSIHAGLSADPKTIEPKWLYDARGSQLFDDITKLPEYRVTRVETAILTERAAEIGQAVQTHVGPGAVLFEPGAGSGAKAALVAGAMEAGAYLAADINAAHLDASLQPFRDAHPALPLHTMGMDMTASMALPARVVADRPVVGFFPGSTIGNFSAQEGAALLARFRTEAKAGALLVGFDLVRAEADMIAAYDDAAGVTAAFNLNLLTRINREAGGTLDETGFRHVAVWNEDASRIEMHLEALRDQTAEVARRTVSFAKGERICTEHSHKFAPSGIEAMAAQGGWRAAQLWTDGDANFAVALLAPA